MFKVVHQGATQYYPPEKIGSFVIRYLKENAEQFLGHPVQDAVITCPAYFNDAQRRATKAAGELAGLHVIRVINEPTAGALAWSYLNPEAKSAGPVTKLVYDCGGGTTDVSIIRVSGSNHTVLATAGDMHCGGNDIDECLTDWLMGIINDPTIAYRQEVIAELRRACEKAKINLTTEPEIELEYAYKRPAPSGGPARKLESSQPLLRSQFNEICKTVLERCLAPVSKALAQARLQPSDIQAIVLVGGTTRLQYLQNRLKQMLPGVPLQSVVNKDEAVALGAGVQAALLKGLIPSEIMDVHDIIPRNLSFKTHTGTAHVMIPANTTIPHTHKEEVYTAEDNQTTMFINIYEGDQPMAADNRKLGDATLRNLPPLPARQAHATLEYTIDPDGILTVTAEQQYDGSRVSVTLNLSL